MIVYFKKVSNLIMILGGVLGGIAAWFYLHGELLSTEHPTNVFIFALWIFAGVILFRVIASVYATRKLKKLQAELYKDCKPQEFLDHFEALNAGIPHNLAEYAHGQNNISFAREALGDFDGAMDAIKDLKPQELRIHALTTTALIVNQKANLQILRKDFEAASFQIEDLYRIKEVAEKRAKMLADNLGQVIRLQEARIAAAKGDENTDIAYLEEEEKLSTNLIHKKEIALELAEYYLRTGQKENGVKKLEAVLENERGLYPETRARELLEDPEKYYVYQEVVRDDTGKEIGQQDADGFVVIRE